MSSNRITRFIWDFVIKSILLDISFIVNNSSVTFIEKFRFLNTKYLIIFTYILFRKFNLGKSRAKIFGHYFYYNHGLAGIGGLQASLIQHINVFKKVQLNTDPVLVDVGANVGNVSYWFLRTFKKSTIYAIEPGELCFGALRENLSAFHTSRFKIFNALCSGERNKLLNFQTNLEESSLSKVLGPQDYSTQVSENIITATTLDSLLENCELNQIDILKIDTEGHELEVLRGAQETLKKVKYLHIELNQSEYSLGEMFSLIYNFSRKIEIIDIRVFKKTKGQIESADLLLKLSNNDEDFKKNLN